MPITAEDLEKYLSTNEDITEEQHEALKKQAETGRLPARMAQLYTPDITTPPPTNPAREVMGPEVGQTISSSKKTIESSNPLEAEYQNLLQREREQEFQDRGFLRGVASDIAGGLVDYGKLGLRAVRAVSPEGSALEKATTSGIEGIERYKEQTPFLQEDPDAGLFSRAIHGGVRSATQSIAAGLPSAAAGAAAGTLIAGPVGTAVGGVLGYALGGASQFGLAQYDDAMERGLKAGLKREDVEASAVRQGLYEGGFEFASDLLEGMTMGAGKLLTAPGKAAVKSTIKDMMKTSFKDLAKRADGVTAIETGSEMLTAGAEAEEDYALGLGNQRFWNGAVDAFGPSVVASLIFAGLGHANVKYAQRKIRTALENPKADPELRAQAADEVYAALQEYNPMVADVWGQTAYQAIKEGKAISTDDNVMEMQEKKRPSQGFKLLHPPPQAYPAQPYSREFARELSELQGTPALPLPERRHWVGPTGEEFVLAGPTEPYSPEAAGEFHRARMTPRLPPGQDFVLAGETNRYSPDFAERLQEGRAARRLAPGQEFDLRGAPEDVASTYSPEFAEVVRPGPRQLPPQEKGFTIEEETPEQKVSRLDTRIKNLGTTLSQYVGQLDKATTPERKQKLTERIRTLQGQIDANREQRASLVAQLPGEPPVEERAPKKSAREAAEVFARESGQVQSPLGRERLREKLKEFESEKAEVMNEPEPPGAVQDAPVKEKTVKGPQISSDLEDALRSATQSITKLNEEIASKPSGMTIREVAEEKAHVKGVLTREIKARNIPVGHAVRATELDELRHIMKTGRLLEGKSFEGTPGISATKITDRNNPAIPIYGSYDRIPVAIIAPPDAHIGKGQSANEVLLDPKTDVRKLKFSIDMHDEVYGFDQLPQVLKEIAGEKGETVLKPAETRAEAGKPYSRKGPETETREKAQGEKGEITKHRPGDMVVYKWNREERFGTIVDVKPDGRFKVAPRDRRGPADMDLVLSEKSLSPYVEPKFQNGDEVEWKDDSGRVRKGKVLSYWPGGKYKIEEPIPGGKASVYRSEDGLNLAGEESVTTSSEQDAEPLTSLERPKNQCLTCS